MTKSWGMILLAVWMAIFAVLSLTNITIVWVGVIHGIVAAGCAVCVLIGK